MGQAIDQLSGCSCFPIPGDLNQGPRSSDSRRRPDSSSAAAGRDRLRGRPIDGAAVAQGRGTRIDRLAFGRTVMARTSTIRYPIRRQRSAERWLLLDRRDGRLRWQPVRRDDEWAVEREGQPPAQTVVGRLGGEKGVCVYCLVYCAAIHVPIDTQDNVCDSPIVLKTKRTYNLSRRTIETVQALAERKVAPTQDALVELAVDELARHVQEADEADAWATAAADPEFAAEAEELEAAYLTVDAETWPKA